MEKGPPPCKIYLDVKTRDLRLLRDSHNIKVLGWISTLTSENCLSVYLCGVGIELKTLCKQGKNSIIEPHPQPSSENWSLISKPKKGVIWLLGNSHVDM